MAKTKPLATVKTVGGASLVVAEEVDATGRPFYLAHCSGCPDDFLSDAARPQDKKNVLGWAGDHARRCR